MQSTLQNTQGTSASSLSLLLNLVMGWEFYPWTFVLWLGCCHLLTFSLPASLALRKSPQTPPAILPGSLVKACGTGLTLTVSLLARLHGPFFPAALDHLLVHFLFCASLFPKRSSGSVPTMPACSILLHFTFPPTPASRFIRFQSNHTRWRNTQQSEEVFSIYLSHSSRTHWSQAAPTDPLPCIWPRERQFITLCPENGDNNAYPWNEMSWIRSFHDSMI